MAILKSVKEREATEPLLSNTHLGSAVDSKPINAEYHQYLRSRLAGNTRALAYLSQPENGLGPETIRHFGLGLSTPYTNVGSGVTMCDALVAPVLSATTGCHSNRSVYLCIPEVTENPIHTVSWMKGEATTYWSDKRQTQDVLMVCSELRDVWCNWQALAEAGMNSDIMVICSTHRNAIPSEWLCADFWTPWRRVYFGLAHGDEGDKVASYLLEFIGREARRLEVPRELGEHWTDFWRNGGDVSVFRSLLKDARVASGATVASVHSDDPAAVRPGRYSYRPVDINGAYFNGYLYYPTEIHVADIDRKTLGLVERRETIVIRSDRTIHRAVSAPAPPGTPICKRVLRLTDGTVIEREPQASSVRTWDFDSIDRYIKGTNPARPLRAILADVLAVLRQAVWLPYDEDYAALALAVPATYVQNVFQSVPLLMLNGPPGSGKTQTGNTMARLCANGVVIGQVSAASAARLIDETRGFVVLDDIESIAARAGKDSQATELVQALKVSYNQLTAKKIWTNVKTMRTEKLDFFGIKLLNNTLGTDPILGSRTLRIQTRKMPEGIEASVREFTVEDLQNLHVLRNELHVWAFENVRDVESVYREIYVAKSDRQAEIAAPLRTMAHLVDDAVVAAKLETYFARNDEQKRTIHNGPSELVTEAVRNLIKQGYYAVTLMHIQLEVRSLFDASIGARERNLTSEWDHPEWIGRKLRSNNLVESGNPGRQRMFGRNLRIVKLARRLEKEVIESTTKESLRIDGKSPDEFCSTCSSCAYRHVRCELRAYRAKNQPKRHAKGS